MSAPRARRLGNLADHLDTVARAMAGRNPWRRRLEQLIGRTAELGCHEAARRLRTIAAARPGTGGVEQRAATVTAVAEDLRQLAAFEANR